MAKSERLETYPAQSLAHAKVSALFVLRRVCYSDSCIPSSRVQGWVARERHRAKVAPIGCELTPKTGASQWASCTTRSFYPKAVTQCGLSGRIPRPLGVTHKHGGDREVRIARGLRDRANPLEVYTDEQMFSHFRFRQYDVVRIEKEVRRDVEFAYRMPGSLSHTTQVDLRNCLNPLYIIHKENHYEQSCLTIRQIPVDKFTCMVLVDRHDR